MSISAFGGQVFLKNGDRLTGTIKQMADGKVTIESELAGTIEIAMDSVLTIESAEPLELHLSDGTVVKQPVEKGPDGQVKVAGGTIKSQTLSLADVSTINPPAPEQPRWKGDLSAALAYTSGNTSNESYSLSFNMGKRSEKDRITFKGDAAQKKEKVGGGTAKVTTEDWMKLGGKYDYFFSERMYAFGEVRYETDEIADLDRRIVTGGGMGYQWIEKPTQNFLTEIGIADVYEKYETSTEANSNCSIRLGYKYDQQFNDIFSFIHDLTYYPNMEEFSDYYLTSSAELRAKINNHLFTNFKVLFDFDATPATGKGSTDTKYLFGVGVNF